MKILLIMDPGILVPPNGYGGHERLVYMFAIEYTRLGHEVHLLVTSGSNVEGCVIHPFGKMGFPPRKFDALKAIPVAWKFLWEQRYTFDLIHNFGRLAYLLPIINSPVHKIMTYGREINSRNIRLMNTLPNRNLVYTGCSFNLVQRANVGGHWEVVYNAIPFDQYTLKHEVDKDAPLMFLGRIERIKGAHSAIKVAKATGHRLILAGNISSLSEELAYFETEIKPHIDGEKIIYVGALDDKQKNHYLGNAKALLFPIEWDEPFGMVMVEAMACGTPVIGINRGAVSEIIKEGTTGFKVLNIEQMKQKVKEIPLISRVNCREVARKMFDVKAIAQKYLNIN
jgi:glycosyltransferase involved in cell wall biosynthesis